MTDHRDAADLSHMVDFGSVTDEYAALRESAMLVDRSSRHRTRVHGSRAAEVLAGLVTNDVQALQPGHGQYAAALTPKGKIVADVRIFRESEDAFIVDAPPRAAEGWWGILRKFVNPRLAAYADVSKEMGDIGVFGVRAAEIAGTALGVSAGVLSALPAYAQTSTRLGEATVLIARVPDAGVPGFEIFAPLALRPEIWRRLHESGARPGGLAAWDIARIEAGRHEWGVDIDDGTLAQEANMDQHDAISYTKGCYTGQETVARVHFRGHVNKHLFGLRFDEPSLPPLGADVLDQDGKSIGSVRSAAHSPRLGGVALAMLRRETAENGMVTLRWEGGQCAAQVVSLPFPLAEERLLA